MNTFLGAICLRKKKRNFLSQILLKLRNMSKAEKENRINCLAVTFLERQQIQPNIFADQIIRGYKEGYHQAEKDIKEELSKLFQEFMLDCINDDTETHILHFVDVFNNKIKTIGNE